ncbi:uncharacterized protein BJ171DRAFT_577440 [Polychytrium aggregatum]|uniref:uncharacterized protein n=1 Tax=Polychytrium aggregatum TaxID=110093 RepID=UPI0022FEBD4A|nr:uncharacterized protein BJ171DRAFT_577440 [Polychytrium aggregatum]KAI9209089.1 hypothetical protein BJ171DRAFT_577440 [Polychytrium aggregatum]
MDPETTDSLLSADAPAIKKGIRVKYVPSRYKHAAAAAAASTLANTVDSKSSETERPRVPPSQPPGVAAEAVRTSSRSELDIDQRKRSMATSRLATATPPSDTLEASSKPLPSSSLPDAPRDSLLGPRRTTLKAGRFVASKVESGLGQLARSEGASSRKSMLPSHKFGESPAPQPPKPSLGCRRTSNAEQLYSSEAKRSALGRPVAGRQPEAEPSKLSSRLVRKPSSSLMPLDENPDPEPGTAIEPAASLKPSSSLPFEEEISSLHARLMQWHIIGTKAEKAFERQRNDAESQLLDMWQILSAKREELYREKLELQEEQQLERLVQELGYQYKMLSSIEKHIPEFQVPFNRFIESLDIKSMRMPLVNAVCRDSPEHLTQALEECNHAMTQLGQISCTSFGNVQELSQHMAKLSSLMQDEWKELEECKELMLEISRLERVEKSLVLGGAPM